MIACWLTRRKIDWEMDDGAATSAAVEIHLSRCAACEGYRRRQLALVKGLIREARQNSPSPPPFCRASVSPNRNGSFGNGGDCRTQSTNGGTLPGIKFAWRQALVLCAAAALVVAVGILRPPPGEAPSSSSERIAKAIRFSGGQSLEEAAGRRLQEWAALLNQPLESEIQFLINDARFAMSSLAASFLPEQYLASVAEGGAKAFPISL